MLYEKCLEIITEKDIKMDELQLDNIRRVLGEVDKNCFKLTLFNIETLWSSHYEWHGIDIYEDELIKIDKDKTKRFIKWISRKSHKELVPIYTFIDNNESIPQVSEV